MPGSATTSGDRARGHRSLAAALRLAEPEQLRLPFVLERGWISPVLRQDPELAEAHRRLFTALGLAQSRPGDRPGSGPGCSRLSRSPTASGRCCGTSRAC